MDGVLVIDKPPGMTSHDVVDRVRKALGTRKVGHAGTLDPDATGVLIVGIGRATRFLSYAQEAEKSYRARARFGTSTSTQDSSGEVIERKTVEITRDDVEREMKVFLGTIEQIPPMVSAVRVGGERLYEKARRGEVVARPARTVTVYGFELVDFSTEEETDATFDIRCSSGTFVRTLIHDLGTALGCGAHMTELRRTEAGGFTDDRAVALDEVSPETLLPLSEAVRCLPQVELDEERAADVSFGRPVRLEVSAEGPVALLREGRLCGVYKPKGEVFVADRVISG